MKLAQIAAAAALASLSSGCATTSFAPQAWRVIRTRDTEAISTGMYVVTVVGFGLWLSYGILRADWTLAIPNAICLLLSAFILVMKLLPRREKEAVAATLDVGHP